MSDRGVLFALDDLQQDQLAEAKGDEQVLAIIERIEERWESEWLFETDKGWDAIHRCLTDGRLDYDNGELPLKLCILGGYQLYEGDDYVVSVTPDDKVAAVATALTSISQDQFRDMYERIDVEEYPDKSEDDLEYTWEMFEGLPGFWGRAASAKRAVVFTVDL